LNFWAILSNDNVVTAYICRRFIPTTAFLVPSVRCHACPCNVDVTQPRCLLYSSLAAALMMSHFNSFTRQCSRLSPPSESDCRRVGITGSHVTRMRVDLTYPVHGAVYNSCYTEVHGQCEPYSCCMPTSGRVFRVCRRQISKRSWSLRTLVTRKHNATTHRPNVQLVSASGRYPRGPAFYSPSF